MREANAAAPKRITDQRGIIDVGRMQNVTLQTRWPKIYKQA
jgi:hypothetical protein